MLNVVCSVKYTGIDTQFGFCNCRQVEGSHVRSVVINVSMNEASAWLEDE